MKLASHSRWDLHSVTAADDWNAFPGGWVHHSLDAQSLGMVVARFWDTSSDYGDAHMQALVLWSREPRRPWR
jgi:hypothetical protein